jgi:hypothetical protein
VILDRIIIWVLGAVFSTFATLAIGMGFSPLLSGCIHSEPEELGVFCNAGSLAVLLIWVAITILAGKFLSSKWKK